MERSRHDTTSAEMTLDEYIKLYSAFVKKFVKSRWMDQNKTDRMYSTSLPEEQRHGLRAQPLTASTAPA